MFAFWKKTEGYSWDQVYQHVSNVAERQSGSGSSYTEQQGTPSEEPGYQHHDQECMGSVPSDPTGLKAASPLISTKAEIYPTVLYVLVASVRICTLPTRYQNIVTREKTDSLLE